MLKLKTTMAAIAAATLLTANANADSNGAVAARPEIRPFLPKNMKTAYQSLAERIRKAKTEEDFVDIDTALERWYEREAITASELEQLDSLATDCWVGIFHPAVDKPERN